MNITPINNTPKNKQSFGFTHIRCQNATASERFKLIFPTKKEYEAACVRLGNMAPPIKEDVPLLVSAETGNRNLRLTIDEDKLPNIKTKSNSQNMLFAIVSINDLNDAFASIDVRMLKKKFWVAAQELITKITADRSYSAQDNMDLLNGVPLVKTKPSSIKMPSIMPFASKVNNS